MTAETFTFLCLRSSGSHRITIKGGVSVQFLVTLMTMYFMQNPFNV